jgi:predicted restriction endonuclease
VADADRKDGLGEFGAGFEAAAGLDAYRAVYRLVLGAYGYRCALTGVVFEQDAGAGLDLVHPDLEVVAIRPREAGGPLQIDNFLALEKAAARAFRAGQILIDDDYWVIPDLAVLNPQVAARLHPGGRLLVPSEPLFQPGRTHLEFHRRSVLGA